MNMTADQQRIVELSEFKSYGSDTEKSYGLDIALNRVFILEMLPLIARGRDDRVIIKMFEEFDLNQYHMSSVKRKFDSSIWNKLCYGHGCWIEEIVFIKSKGTRMTRIRRIFTDLGGSDSDLSFC